MYADTATKKKTQYNTFSPLIGHSFPYLPYLPVQSSSSDDIEKDMDFSCQMSNAEAVGNDTEDGLEQDEVKTARPTL